MLLSDNSFSRSHTSSLLAKMRSTVVLFLERVCNSTHHVPHFSRIYLCRNNIFTIYPPFLLDFENNGTVEISEFFCVGLAIENKFLDQKFSGFGGFHWGSVIRGGRLPQKAHLRHLR